MVMFDLSKKEMATFDVNDIKSMIVCHSNNRTLDFYFYFYFFGESSMLDLGLQNYVNKRIS